MTTAKAPANATTPEAAAAGEANATAAIALGEHFASIAPSLGFARLGAVSIARPTTFAHYEAWLARAHHGEMHYLAEPLQRESRADATRLMPSAQTAIVAALPYDRHVVPAQALTARIARYATGHDYHWVFKERLTALLAAVNAAAGTAIAGRACVDSAPVLERDAAAAAGLGFVGKNTMLIAPGTGSNLLLGVLLIDAAAIIAQPALGPRCGACTACLDACPTGAFTGPYQLDARRCISYLTIELRADVPRELRPLMGQWVFGCDLCQDACPFNQARRRAAPPDAMLVRHADAPNETSDLRTLATISTSAYKRLVHGTSMARVSRNQFLRNVALALGNTGDARAVPAVATLCLHAHALVRTHAYWAMARLAAQAACEPALALRALVAAQQMIATPQEQQAWDLEARAIRAMM
ncbi:MAG: tRNA epoxyqueuosine(34) reductase QueG [Myxococcales bacterium]|nr:tRNA epoxyqueuosine(34) reductase QueG [Myxococcales bacterium]